MFKFIKTPDEINTSTVEMTLPDASTLETLFDELQCFLQACGYVFGVDDYIGICNDYENEKNVIKDDAYLEDAYLELKEKEYFQLLQLAHEMDITFNELVTIALSDMIEKIKAKDKFDILYEKLQNGKEIKVNCTKEDSDEK